MGERVWRIDVDNKAFWAEVDQARWTGGYKAQMAKAFPEDAGKIPGHNIR
ncbi:hypothetical protein [Sinomonas susongensis]|nr:hypothetical protein [Sinomonas susongensis]